MSEPDARVDLNSDLGESYGRRTLGDDAAMVEHITSANLACGFVAIQASEWDHYADPAADW